MTGPHCLNTPSAQACQLAIMFKALNVGQVEKNHMCTEQPAPLSLTCVNQEAPWNGTNVKMVSWEGGDGGCVKVCWIKMYYRNHQA